METEQETTQSLEAVLDKGQVSEEQEEVSEEATQETETQEVDKDTKAQFDARVQAEVDKRLNTYREKREADTALLRSQQDQIKELKSQSGVQGINKAMAAILEGDEEDGVEPDKIAARKKGLEEIRETIKTYNEKVSEVEEAATLASAMSGKIDKNIAQHFDLFDSNPTVRAKGAISLITDAVFFLNREKAFNKILEEIPLLQNGSEVRQQIDSFVERYLELSDDKGRDLLINQLKQEFKGTPRRKPTAPSDGSGGGGKPLRGVAALAEGLKEERAKLKNN